MTATPAEREREAVELTPRRCRYCGRLYVWPKHSRATGCPECAPPLFHYLTGRAAA